MPTYIYKNLTTGEVFEVQQRMVEDALTHHPQTGDPVKKLVSAPAIAFKGSGFYANDSRASQSSGANKPKAEDSSGKSEGKSEGKAEGKSESGSSDSTAPSAPTSGAHVSSTPSPSTPPASTPSSSAPPVSSSKTG